MFLYIRFVLVRSIAIVTQIYECSSTLFVVLNYFPQMLYFTWILKYVTLPLQLTERSL